LGIHGLVRHVGDKTVEERKAPKEFQVNKFWRMLLSVLLVMLGAAITYMAGLDWKTIVGPDKAGIAVMVIGLIKTIYETFAPGVGVHTTPIPESSTASLITHRAVPEYAVNK